MNNTLFGYGIYIDANYNSCVVVENSVEHTVGFRFCEPKSDNIIRNCIVYYNCAPRNDQSEVEPNAPKGER